jgi:antitoxin component YwqK of YwqJK toxin-antitoxin module
MNSIQPSGRTFVPDILQKAKRQRRTKVTDLAADSIKKQVRLDNPKPLTLKKITPNAPLSAKLVLKEKLTGYFEMVDENGDMYKGDVVNGLPNGMGEYYDRDGKLFYKGEIKNGMKHGEGIAYAKDGSVEYIGSYYENQYHGFGKVYNKDGELVRDGYWVLHEWYLGQIKNRKPNGWGSTYTQEGCLVFSGVWVNGVPNGPGKEYLSGLYFDGHFKNGMKDGPGVMYWLGTSNKRASGNWKEGLPDRNMVYYDRNGMEEGLY